MTITQPMLGLIALPLMFGIAVLARRVAGKVSRWAIRAAAVSLAIGIAGTEVRCDRPLRIAVMVDVSPSTRTATFRDAASVTARLRLLLGGRPYALHYFADGLQTSGDELSIAYTRLESPPDVDAIVLMSDGRIDAPANLPPIFPVIDPALDRPSDGCVTNVRLSDARVLVQTRVEGPQRMVRLHGALPEITTLSQAQETIEANATAQRVTAQLNPVDAWPENDVMSAGSRPRAPSRRWAIGLSAPDFDALAPASLPAELSDYLDISCVLLDTRVAVSDTAAGRLGQYVKQLGGTLICVGPPSELPKELQSISPLSADPPAPVADWTLLLDASGSMGTIEDAGTTRWSQALSAAQRAVGRLPESARVSVIAFARSPRVVVDRSTPADALTALASLRDIAPAGPTGLRAALESLSTADATRPTQVLLLSDADAELGDVDALARRLHASQIHLSALGTRPSLALETLAAATGGQVAVSEAPSTWAAAFEALASLTNAPVVLDGVASMRGTNEFAASELHLTRRWKTWLRQGATALGDVNEEPVVARWQAGAGRVVSITADAAAVEISGIAKRLEQPVQDPRFAVSWDMQRERVRLSSRDADRPMNALAAKLVRDGVSTDFEQTAPGEYEAPIDRSPNASIATVRVGAAVIARAALPSRYAREFDAIGNDTPALRDLAERTGGAVIEPGNQRQIAFARTTQTRSLTPWCAALAALSLCIAVIFNRGR